MAVAYRSFTSGTYTSSTGTGEVTASKPSGLANGDVLVAIYGNEGSTSDSGITAPAGFVYQGGGGLPSEAAVHVWIKPITDAAAEASTYAWDCATTTWDSTLLLIAVSGGALATAQATIVTLNNGSQTSHDGTAGTVATDGSLVLHAIAFDGADTSPLFDGYPTGYTEIDEIQGGSGSFGLTLWAGYSAENSGAFPAPNWTSGIWSDDSVIVSVILTDTEVIREDITHVTSDSFSVSTGSSQTLSMTGAQENDVAILVVGGDGHSAAFKTYTVTEGGWAQIDVNETTPGRDLKSQFWWKRLGVSETSVQLNISASDEWMGGVSVFRGVDEAIAFDVAYSSGSHHDAGQNNNNPNAGSIATATQKACLVAIHIPSHDDITSDGPPSGLTTGFGEYGQSNRQGFLAYDLDAGGAGTKSPGNWTHTTNGTNVSEYHTYILALRPGLADSGTTYGGGSSGLRSASRLDGVAGAFNGSASGTSSGLRSGSRLGGITGAFNGAFPGVASGLRSAVRIGAVAGSFIGTFTGSASGVRSTVRVGAAGGELSGTFTGSAPGVRSAPRLGSGAGSFTGTFSGSASGVWSAARIGTASGALVADAQTFTGAAPGISAATRIGSATGALVQDAQAFTGSSTGLRAPTQAGDAGGTLFGSFTGAASGLRSSLIIGGAAGNFTGSMAGVASGIRSQARIGAGSGTLVAIQIPAGATVEIPFTWQDPVLAAQWPEFDAPMLWADHELIAKWKEAA